MFEEKKGDIKVSPEKMVDYYVLKKNPSKFISQICIRNRNPIVFVDNFVIKIQDFILKME